MGKRKKKKLETVALIALLIIIIAFSACIDTCPESVSSGNKLYIIEDYGNNLYSIKPTIIRSDNSKALTEGLVYVNEKCDVSSFTGYTTSLGSGMGMHGVTTEIMVKACNCSQTII